MKEVLHSMNALRVIAEYLVVRVHIIASLEVGTEMFVRDLMSFFFVLSGFVMMYTHHDSCFGSWQQKVDFWVGRWIKTYPSFIVNFSFHVPFLVNDIIHLDHGCVYGMYCASMQLLFLSCWAGCGVHHIYNGPSWYLSTLAWLWLLFPLMHGTLKNVFSSMHWGKMGLVSVASTGVIYLFSGYDVFTICTLPVLRLGEFVIGCGIACLMQEPQPEQLSFYRWGPAALVFVYFMLVYTLLGLPHGMDWLCLNESMYDTGCRIWHKADKIQATPPCYVVWDKFFNKHAMLWAVIVYTIASAEKAGDTGVVMTLLGHDIFKFFSTFSLSLYLGHTIMGQILTGITRALGWGDFWHDDTILICVYVMCYMQHLLTDRISRFVHDKCKYSFKAELNGTRFSVVPCFKINEFIQPPEQAGSTF